MFKRDVIKCKAEMINVATPGTCPGSAHRGGGIQEDHENQLLSPRSQTPAGVGAGMDKAPGKGPSAPGRITERKGKGDFVVFKPILVEGGSVCSLSASAMYGMLVHVTNGRKHLFRK